MKKIIVLFFLLVGINRAYSQVGLTQTLTEIKSEYPEGYFDDDYNGEVIYTLYDEELYCLRIFCFNDTMMCYKSIIVPEEQKVTQLWVESMNEEWVVVSDTEWKYYRSDGYIFSCDFEVDGDQKQAFIYTIKKYKN